MPKQDRAAQIKKENQGVRKRIAAEGQQASKQREKEEREAQQQEEERLAEEQAKAKAPPPSKFDTAMSQGAAKSSFAKATLAEHSDDDDDGGAAAAPAAGPAAGKSQERPKKETAASRKKQEAQRYKDELRMMEEEQKVEMRKRIKSRFLRLLVVGFFMEDRGENEKDKKASAQNSGKSNKKKGGRAAESETWSFQQMREKASLYSGPLLMGLFVGALFLARIAGEDFSVDLRAEQTNYYEVMGLTADADVMAIRKAYKALALSWHPDKNPGCTSCAERFDKISKAYETLSNPDEKKAYDQRKAPKGSLNSLNSVDLTDQDVEAKVFRSNEVWFLQIYDPTEGMSKNFHPVWEEIATSHQQLARFGRIDVGKYRGALALLPQKIVIFPVVFRFARGHAPEMFQWQRGERDEKASSQPFARFVQDNFPLMQRLDTEKELKRWWEAAADRPRVLMSGAVSRVKGGSGSLEFLQAQRQAHVWSEFFDFATAEARLVEQARLEGAELTVDGSGSWSVFLRSESPRAAAETKVVMDLEDLSTAVLDVVTRAMAARAPAVTVRNHQQLCGAHGIGSSRTFCLVMVDASDASGTAKALDEVNASRVTFAQEALELKAQDEEATEEGEEGGATEEAFHIQMVRLMTSTSRLPWEPVAAGAQFKALWSEVGHASTFVLELETRRVAAVKASRLSEIYQQIGYDDLKFRDLPESIVSLAHGLLPDPEVPLKRLLSRFLSTLPGSLLGFLVLASGIAVAPELSLAAAGAFAAASTVVLLAIWPMAFRRAVAVVWCSTQGGRFECQI